MSDIDVVDGLGRDDYVRMARTAFPHALRVADLGDMVQQLIARVGFTRSLRRLRVFGHGHPGSQAIGNSLHQGSIFNAPNFVDADWMRIQNLADLFQRHGWMEMHGCNVAQGPAGKAYLAHLAGLLRVPVRAGVALQWGGPRHNYEFLWGAWREARPAPHGGVRYHAYHAR